MNPGQQNGLLHNRFGFFHKIGPKNWFWTQFGPFRPRNVKILSVMIPLTALHLEPLNLKPGQYGLLSYRILNFWLNWAEFDLSGPKNVQILSCLIPARVLHLELSNLKCGQYWLFNYSFFACLRPIWPFLASSHENPFMHNFDQSCIESCYWLIHWQVGPPAAVDRLPHQFFLLYCPF